MNSTKAFCSILIFCLSSQLQAITFSLIGPCSETPVKNGTFEVSDLSANIIRISSSIFDKYGIDYNANADGITSIINTPTGKDSVEDLGEGKIRAYGWCYTINGVITQASPKETMLSSNDDQITWFFGYSTYENDKWSDYCEPSYKIKAAQFCNK